MSSSKYFTLLPLADLFILTPTQLLCEEFSRVEITAQILHSLISIITVYSQVVFCRVVWTGERELGSSGSSELGSSELGSSGSSELGSSELGSSGSSELGSSGSSELGSSELGSSELGSSELGSSGSSELGSSGSSELGSSGSSELGSSELGSSGWNQNVHALKL